MFDVAMNRINIAGRTMRCVSRNSMYSAEFYRRLPLVSAHDDIGDLSFYRDVITHSSFDDFWKSYSMRYTYEDVDAPALIVSGRYDNLVHKVVQAVHVIKYSGCSVNWNGAHGFLGQASR